MKTLIVGDIHNPVAHPAYLPFCQSLQEEYQCDDVMFIGDVVDWHAISFHSKHPEAPGPKDEHELAYEAIQRWATAFPRARVCIGNHDARVIRTAEEAGIPSKFIRNFAETWGTPGWDWQNDFVLDDVYYFHGTGTSGIHPAFNSMCKQLMSVVQGHIHSAGGIKWRANPQRRVFGMDVGCGIDDRAYAFAYGRDQKIRSILSAAVVLDGVPQHCIMPCGPGEEFNRANFAQETKNAKVFHVRSNGPSSGDADRKPRRKPKRMRRSVGKATDKGGRSRTHKATSHKARPNASRAKARGKKH